MPFHARSHRPQNIATFAPLLLAVAACIATPVVAAAPEECDVHVHASAAHAHVHRSPGSRCTAASPCGTLAAAQAEARAHATQHGNATVCVYGALGVGSEPLRLDRRDSHTHYTGLAGPGGAAPSISGGIPLAFREVLRADRRLWVASIRAPPPTGVPADRAGPLSIWVNGSRINRTTVRSDAFATTVANSSTVHVPVGTPGLAPAVASDGVVFGTWWGWALGYYQVPRAAVAAVAALSAPPASRRISPLSAPLTRVVYLHMCLPVVW